MREIENLDSPTVENLFLQQGDRGDDLKQFLEFCVESRDGVIAERQEIEREDREGTIARVVAQIKKGINEGDITAAEAISIVKEALGVDSEIIKRAAVRFQGESSVGEGGVHVEKGSCEQKKLLMIRALGLGLSATATSEDVEREEIISNKVNDFLSQVHALTKNPNFRANPLGYVNEHGIVNDTKLRLNLGDSFHEVFDYSNAKSKVRRIDLAAGLSVIGSTCSVISFKTPATIALWLAATCISTLWACDFRMGYILKTKPSISDVKSPSLKRLAREIGSIPRFKLKLSFSTFSDNCAFEVQMPGIKQKKSGVSLALT